MTKPGQGARFVRIGQASKLLKRSIKQVQGMVERGELRERRYNGQRLFLLSELEVFMQKDRAIGAKDVGRQEQLAFKMLRGGASDPEVVEELALPREVVRRMRAELEGRPLEPARDEEDEDDLADVEIAVMDSLAKTRAALVERAHARLRRRTA